MSKLIGIENVFKYFGLIAAIVAWIVIGTCIILNPWFVFTRDAFSDSGSVEASMPWIYKLWLNITGIIYIIFTRFILLYLYLLK